MRCPIFFLRWLGGIAPSHISVCSLPFVFVLLVMSSGCGKGSYSLGLLSSKIDPIGDTFPTRVCSQGEKFIETQKFAASEIVGTAIKTNVVFVLDTSGSMGNEIISLSSTLPKFLTRLNEALGKESNRVVLDASFDTTVDENGVKNEAHQAFKVPPEVYLHSASTDVPFDSWDKIVRIRSGLGFGLEKHRIPSEKLIIESGATFHHVIITDDVEYIPGCKDNTFARVSPEICSSDYHSKTVEMMANKGWSSRLHAIHIRPESNAARSGNCSYGNLVATTGAPYINLTSMFKGGSYDLCSPDWDMLFGDLVNSIVDSSSSSALKSCSNASFRINKAFLIQGSKREQLDASNEIKLTQGAASRSASFQLVQGVLGQRGFKTQEPYSIEVHYEIVGSR